MHCPNSCEYNFLSLFNMSGPLKVETEAGFDGKFVTNEDANYKYRNAISIKYVLYACSLYIGTFDFPVAIAVGFKIY